MPGSVCTFFVLFLWGAVMVAFGALDLRLVAEGLPTLSHRVWAGNWLLGAAIVGWALVGPTFLVAHFFFGLFRD